MGRITSLYLTDDESAELKKFCDENQCTQYSALKAALRELLSKPLNKGEETPITEETINTQSIKQKEESKQTSEERLLLELLKKLS